MQIDRRITNGLAWAGALLVVGIPAADFVLRQFNAPPQVAVVQDENTASTPLPTPVSERPVPVTPPPAAEAPAPVDPVTTANAGTAAPTGNGGAVDAYLQSGRELPSYISGGSPSAPAATPKPQPTQPVTPAPAPAQPSVPTPAPAATQPPASTPPATAATQTPPAPRTRIVTLPTPVSERPPSVASRPPVVAQPPAASQAPLIVNQPANIVTADDLDDWETGPLSDFLSRRGGNPPPTQDFDDGGFFLDEAPGRTRVQRLPDAYDDGYYYPSGQ